LGVTSAADTEFTSKSRAGGLKYGPRRPARPQSDKI